MLVNKTVRKVPNISSVSPTYGVSKIPHQQTVGNSDARNFANEIQAMIGPRISFKSVLRNHHLIMLVYFLLSLVFRCQEVKTFEALR